MKDAGATIVLVDFNQATETTQRYLNSRKDSGRNFYLVSIADNFTEAEAKSKMDTFTSEVETPIAGIIIKAGKLEDHIEEISKEVKASAMVFTINAGSKKGFFTSPRSLKLISSLNLVFVVLQHGAKIGPIKSIAMPLELTSESKQKFGPALILAEDEGAELKIFLPRFKDEFHESAVSRNMLWTERYLKDTGVRHKFTKAEEKGSFEDQFIEFIDRDHVDVVVILNYGDTFLSGFFRSTEMQILENKYKIPVLIMNHKATYRTKIPVLGQ